MDLATDRTTLRRARTATCLLFLLFGTALGAWTSRIPSVKSHLDLSDGLLSLALLAFALGAIAGMTALGRLADRYGSTRVMVPMALLEGLLLVPPAYVPDLAALILALFLFGLVHGTLNIAMNANALEVQRAWGRPIMSSFHAVYSIGGFLGSAAGGLFARQGLSAGTTFLSVGAAVILMAVWAAVWALPTTPGTVAPREDTPAESAGHGVIRSPELWFLGTLAMCALVGEGTAADWSAVYLHEDLGSSPAFAAAAFATFSITMTVGRLFGDRLTTRFGPVALVRACGVLAFHALRTTEIRTLTLTDLRDLDHSRLHLPNRTVLLADPVRIRLLDYLTHRTATWPRTATPHLFLTRRTAISTTPVSRPWLYRHYPSSSHLLRADRLVDEAQAAGDARMLCELFGLTFNAATRYTRPYQDTP
ncbi:MFS transporter [Streptomyces mirabilis]|uniref:MFS transporter n=1 Tax=Streptomyces mirabilis TaxID=68239 RepID=UPI0036792D0A